MAHGTSDQQQRAALCTIEDSCLQPHATPLDHNTAVSLHPICQGCQGCLLCMPTYAPCTCAHTHMQACLHQAQQLQSSLLSLLSCCAACQQSLQLGMHVCSSCSILRVCICHPQCSRRKGPYAPELNAGRRTGVLLSAWLRRLAAAQHAMKCTMLVEKASQQQAERAAAQLQTLLTFANTTLQTQRSTPGNELVQGRAALPSIY